MLAKRIYEIMHIFPQISWCHRKSKYVDGDKKVVLVVRCILNAITCPNMSFAN